MCIFKNSNFLRPRYYYILDKNYFSKQDCHCIFWFGTPWNIAETLRVLWTKKVWFNVWGVRERLEGGDRRTPSLWGPETCLPPWPTALALGRPARPRCWGSSLGNWNTPKEEKPTRDNPGVSPTQRQLREGLGAQCSLLLWASTWLRTMRMGRDQTQMEKLASAYMFMYMYI